jgi:hypothetical protein
MLHRAVLLTVACVVALYPFDSPPLEAQTAASRLFQTREPLVLQLKTNLRALFRDRGDARVDHGAVLHYRVGVDTGTLDVKLRTRGIFRLKRCAFPPLRLDLPGRKKLEGTPFAAQDKLKLVTHCQSDRSYERNLLKEYSLYRVFNALTDTSHRVRLAMVTYLDSARADTVTRYGFLIESDAELARRVGTKVLEIGNLHDMLTDPSYMTLVSVFQYLIGNTDWSVWGRHNIVVLRDSGPPERLFAVPYDYDFSGAVGAPYAIPPEQLPIKSVRERLYRGYCQPDSVLMPVLARFRAAKDSIYAAVRAVPDLREGDARSILSYFDDFFRAIDNPGTVQREFVRRCRALPQ